MPRERRAWQPLLCVDPLYTHKWKRELAGATDGVDGAAKPGWKTYTIDGPLFFGSTSAFNDLFDPKKDPTDVVLDFMESRVADHSALEAVNRCALMPNARAHLLRAAALAAASSSTPIVRSLARRYGELGKTVHLRHLSPDCAALLERLNGELPPYEIIESDPATDPAYEVAED